MSNIFRGIGVASVAAAIAIFAFEVQAQAPKKKSPACSSLKEEGMCKTRDDCTWVSAVMDASGKKEKKKGYCRAMPKPKQKT
jgi:hypothetical protein